MRSQGYRLFKLSKNEDSDAENIGIPLQINATGIIVMEKPFVTKPLVRRDYYLQYMWEGSLYGKAGERDFVLHPGQLLLYPPGTTYTYHNQNEKIVYLYIHFTGNDAERLVEECALPLCTPVNIGIDEKLADAIKELMQEFVVRDPYFEVACRSKLQRILVSFRRKADRFHPTPEISAAKTITSTLLYIQQHFAEPLTVSLLAEQAHLSAGRYRFLVKKLTGMTPTAYVSQVRVRRAAELLSQTDWPLKTIASAVGISDPLYFSRLFKQETGLSPTAFRKNENV